ncbi:MAG: SigB/SigF/SigG family RNA polymerase sigma factor [Christensenellales bacterium]
MLDNDTTLHLLSLAKNGDNDAKNRLIEENSPLVKSIVRRYKNKGVEYDDLFQLGCLGFAKAINNFDVSFGVKFSTYAVPMIAGEIKRFLRDDGSVKVARSTKTLYYSIQKYLEQQEQQGLPTPTPREIAKHFEIDESELMFVMESAKMPLSIYDSVGKDDSSSIVLDKLSQGDTTDELISKITIYDLLSTLDEKDRKLLVLRYFRDKTQTEVAEMLGVSQVQISRRESKLLSRLKNTLGDIN